MRIVLVYQHFMVSGVGSTKPYDLARYLVAAGHEVTVLCGRGFLAQGMDIPRGLVRRLDIDGIDVLCLGVDYRQRMGFLRRVASFLAFAFLAMLAACLLPRYDVMLASSTPLTVGLVALAARHVRRIPYVFEIRDLWPEVPYQAGFLPNRTLFRISTWFEEWFYRDASAVCSISELMRRRLVDRKVPAAKTHFIPTGVDLEAFEVPPADDFRRLHGLEGCFVAVYVGSHGPSDGLDYVIEAARSLRDVEGVRLVLIGEGSQKARLMERSRQLGLEGRPLVFLPPIPRGRVAGVLKACDVTLTLCADVPGMQYLMPNKFFDYLAAGKPLVANVRAECADWIRRAGCGILADPQRPAGLAEVLLELRAHPGRMRRMGRRARQLARRRFDRRKLNARWETILSRAAQEKHHAR